MNNEVNEIEIQIEQAREFIKLQEAAERLKKNKDFQLLILDEYFKNEAVRMTEALSAPPMQTEKYQEAIIKALTGIGQLQQFFNKVEHQAMQAEAAIEEGNQALSEIHEEGELH